jgi:hypothetical protein
VNGSPEHPFAVGVTVYLIIPGFPLPTIAGLVNVGLVRSSSINGLHEEGHDVNPVTAAPDNWIAVQVKVVPTMDGIINELRSILVLSPQQIVNDYGVPTGTGLTVIGKVQVLIQPFISVKE